jgi:NAD(P)-dependent dehydrogenase (short-subunit alcohol dehydrogenase family)
MSALANKVALVTGSTSGIGRGIAEHFASLGVRMVVHGRREAQAGEIAEALRAAGHDAAFVATDLADVEGCRRAVRFTIDHYGGIDVLVNNAANDDRHTVEQVTPEYWDDRMAVNLRHQFFAAQAVVPAMKRVGGGVILNFGSISWHLGLEDLVLYQTAKAAIEGMTRALARDLGRYGIRVNTIVPGNVKTPRQMKWYTPEGEAEIVKSQCIDGRIQPSDVAAMVLFLSSDDARMCTAHDYFVDAGWR